jgi:hypothetical protein
MAEQLTLVPYSEADPEDAALQLWQLLQDSETTRQLADIMPDIVTGYGASTGQALERFNQVVQISEKDSGFIPYLQVAGGLVIGAATIDSRIAAYEHKLAPHIYRGPIATKGPSTSSWIAAPYQGKGHGRESLQKRIKIAVIDQSNPGVWIKVKDSNVRSMNNAVSRGFTKIADSPVWYAGKKQTDSSIFQYDA